MTYVIHHYPSHPISDPSSADHTPFTNGLIGARALPSCRSARLPVLRLPTPAARHIATRRHLPWQGLSLLTPATVALAPPRPVAWRHCRPTRVQVQSHVTHLGYSVADPAGLPRAPEPT
ncbi:hypothetical protein TIFTF001_010157 [Ficus carica]|uniref:Uncharacterized protein n=1 Tax=Ficus carica TaxID=3494 RepID=A0AA88A873_FICCA|nr:hypothetical protein TIFTF001_010157 [Ficus carica]